MDTNVQPQQPQQPQESTPSVLDGYITREALATQLNKSGRTIDRWQMLRIGPPRVVLGRTILYRVDSVREWLASREQQHSKRTTRGLGSR